MSKFGRNDPCPCGSGKKYKHCCYGKRPQSFEAGEDETRDPEWQKIRRTEGTVVDAVLRFAKQRYGEEILEEAWEEFTLWGEYSVKEIHFETIFIPWFTFNWTPDAEISGSTPLAGPEEPLALTYLQEGARRLIDYEQRFIRAVCQQPFSFFVVIDVVTGKNLGLRDLLIERTFTVKEASASRILKRGDIIFGRVLSLDGQAIMVGCAPVILPPSYHYTLLDYRDGIRKALHKSARELDLEFLREADVEVREMYFDAAESTSNPSLPKLRNTDGDPLAFVKLHFELQCSPQEAVERLRTLVLPEYQDGILQDSVRDADGILLKATFDWQKRGNKTQKHWDNTILGHLAIDGNKLTAEVNSRKRAKKIQSEIQKLLGKRTAFKGAVYESAERKLEEMRSRPGTDLANRAREEAEDFNSSPEIEVFVKKQMEAHWEAWFDQPIPALQNKTPREAARTKPGRERLEALLLEYERRNEHLPQPSLRADIQGIRKRLGL